MIEETTLLAPPKTPPQATILPLLKSGKNITDDLVDYLLKCKDEYGDIFGINLGLLKIIVCSHPRHAQFMFRDKARSFQKTGPFWDTVRVATGNGLIVSNGDFWLRQRRMMQPHFHRRSLAKISEGMLDAIEKEMNTRWDQYNGTSDPFEISEAFNYITMNVVVRALFGMSLNPEAADELGEKYRYINDYMLAGMALGALPSWMPVPYKRRYHQSRLRVDEIVADFITTSRHSDDMSDDLLTMLIHMVDDETGEQMTDKQLIDEVVTLFSAGYETTSVSLSWIIHFMTIYPDVLTKLKNEIDFHLGSRIPTFKDLPNLQYTRWVVMEALRHHSPSWMIPRETAEDVEMDGYHIPAGTTVLCFNQAIHHRPDVWQEPEKFIPERFSKENSAGRHGFAWMPFGAGQRKCIGYEFAIMEAQLIIARMLQRYDVTAVPNHSPKPRLSVTFKLDKVLVHLNPKKARTT